MTPTCCMKVGSIVRMYSCYDSYLLHESRQHSAHVLLHLRVVGKHRVLSDHLLSHLWIGRQSLHHRLHVGRLHHVLHQLGVLCELRHQTLHARRVEHTCNSTSLITGVLNLLTITHLSPRCVEHTYNNTSFITGVLNIPETTHLSSQVC